jgi:hypothetical protein
MEGTTCTLEIDLVSFTLMISFFANNRRPPLLLAQGILPDAGASPTHQVSQRDRGRQLDRPAQILKTLWELLHKYLMKQFMKAHFVYCNGP